VPAAFRGLPRGRFDFCWPAPAERALRGRPAAAVVGTAGQDTVSTAGFIGAIKGVAALAVYGGGGADTISVAYQGKLTGTLALYLDGQGGNDTVAATVKLDSGSTGSLAAVVEGATAPTS
jgi:hypothetical protein